MATAEIKENDVRKYLTALSAQDSQKQEDASKIIRDFAADAKGAALIFKCGGVKALVDVIKGPPKPTTLQPAPTFKFNDLYNLELSDELQKNILFTIASITTFHPVPQKLHEENISEVLFNILLYFTHKKSKTTNVYAINTHNPLYLELFPAFVTCVDKIGKSLAEHLTNKGIIRVLVTIFKSAYDINALAVAATLPLLVSLTTDDFVKSEFYVYDALPHLLAIVSSSVRLYKTNDESKKNYIQALRLLATVSSYALLKIDLQFGNPENLLPLVGLVNFGEGEVQENAKKVIKNLGLKDSKLVGDMVMAVFERPSSNIKSYMSDGTGCVVSHNADFSLFRFQKSYLLAYI